MISEIYIALASTRLRAQVKFYSSFFSMPPQVQTDSYAEFRFPGLKLAIFTPNAKGLSEFHVKASAQGLAQNSKSPMSFCMEVESLTGAIAHLTELGYPPPGDIIRASHGQEIYAYDPDGNRLILHQS